ncbi:MAG TPA: hypothetical protein VN948_18945 [Terriglobales bacterium]|nr:hypothetical protein [Terriglobales bacterium]
MRNRFWAALFNCVALLFLSGVVLARAGDLDKTFGNGGLFTTSLTQASVTLDNKITVQSDGKVIVAGQIQNHATLIRLKTDGTLDSSFGTGGVVTLNFLIHDPAVVGMAIQSDGKIVAAISSIDTSPSPLVARFNTDGSLDTTFGSGGSANLTIVGATALALQPDGKILVAAGSNPQFLTAPPAMTRLNPNGQLDTSFGTSGVAVLFGPSTTAMALQADGKILIASGTLWIAAQSGYPAFPTGLIGVPLPGLIARYNTNGRIDKSFGISGQTACLASASAIALQSDGRIVVGGSITSQLAPPPAGNDAGFGLVRYNRNGTIDSSFGQHGVVITGFAKAGPLASSFALAVQSNGDIIAAGQVGQGVDISGNPGPSSFALARYTSAGKLDTTFGSGGKVVTTLGSTNTSFISALTLQADGKIVVAGNSEFNTAQGFVNNFAVARYLAQ